MIVRISKAEVYVADNTNRCLDNSRYDAKADASNCFILHIPEPL